MNFNKLVTLTLQAESKALRLPPGADRLVEDVMGKIGRMCNGDLWEAGWVKIPADVLDDTEEYETEPVHISDIFVNMKDYVAINKDSRFMFSVYTRPSKPKKGSKTLAAGIAHIPSGVIELYLPYGGPNSNNEWSKHELKQIILHELMHIFDPTLQTDNAMHILDYRIGAYRPGEKHRGGFDNKNYLKYVGWRSGNIPIEFNPRMNEILRTSPDILKKFLHRPRPELLRSEKEFAAEMLGDPYLRRKMLEKIFNYLVSIGYDVNEEDVFKNLNTKGRRIFVYSNEREPTIFKVKDRDVADIWNNWKSFFPPEVGMTNTIKSFSTYENFYDAVKEFIDENNLRKDDDLIRALNAFKRIEAHEGVYKLLANDEHGSIMIGKELY